MLEIDLQPFVDGLWQGFNLFWTGVVNPLIDQLLPLKNSPVDDLALGISVVFAATFVAVRAIRKFKRFV